MASTTKAIAESIDRLDPVWTRVREEAEQAIAREPALGGFIYATILHHQALEESICHRLSQRLMHPDVDAGLLDDIFDKLLRQEPELSAYFRADLLAVVDRDPACNRLIEPLLYFKGFHALETHRFAHLLWKSGRKDFALYLQSQCSRVFSIDIHPAARIGRGIFIDHGHALVIGETAVVGDDVSMLHSVTLGGTGKESGDRHPKIGNGVMIGAGAKVLGNISIGPCSRIAAGSVVLKDVPPRTTVAGVPARIIGESDCLDPARTMDQMFARDSIGSID
jgi:serine O-acetyltransferase